TLPQVFSELFAAARGGEGVLTGFTGVHSAARGGEGARPIAERAESATSAAAVITLAAALHAHDGHDAHGVGDPHDAGEVGDPHDAGEVGDPHDAGEVDARAGLEAVQASYLDAIRDGDAMVVLNGTTVRVLGGIAPTIMEAATASPRTLPQLVRTVVTVHGDPDDADAAELVAAAVDELKQIGLLRVVGASE
ncbi:MAG: hypothetical protein JWQ64_3734, partial [Subtercola sp.]|nr:hypothetical protein [Subtercola sp.]